MLIEIEGIDGSGKTTQCSLLKQRLVSAGREVVIAKEPGWGTAFGVKLREVLMSDTGRDNRAEMFAFLACKSQLYSEIINPALAKGKDVVSDRGSGSFLSYNHVISGIDLDSLEVLLRTSTLEARSAFTFLLDVDVSVAQERKRQQADHSLTRYDKLSMAFFRRQREIYMQLATKSPNWIVIDASLSVEEIEEQIMKEVSPFLS